MPNSILQYDPCWKKKYRIVKLFHFDYGIMHKLNNSIKRTKSFGFYKFLIIDFDINIKKYEKKLKIDCNSDLFLRYS